MSDPGPEAVFFDMDDTLVDFSSSASSCWKQVCDQAAGRCGGVSAERLLAALNAYRHWFWNDPDRHQRGRLDMAAARREVVAGALLRVGVRDPVLVEEMAQAFSEARAAAIRLFPEAADVLRALRARPVKLALITNGEVQEQRNKIERFALAPFFDYILVEAEFGVGKPDPRVYRHALSRLSATARATWMVGDNPEWDVLAPQRVGIRGIWRDVRGTGWPPGCPGRPDRIIRSLMELLPDTPPPRGT
ncbi:MAG TPA: HAD family hydrolase [Candidatus Sulfotelmatobacter sp.]|nr:HAD family hydrolase [Candidatus Sulfotelmatobacter sp.]